MAEPQRGEGTGLHCGDGDARRWRQAVAAGEGRSIIAAGRGSDQGQTTRSGGRCWPRHQIWPRSSLPADDRLHHVAGLAAARVSRPWSRDGGQPSAKQPRGPLQADRPCASCAAPTDDARPSVRGEVPSRSTGGLSPSHATDLLQPGCSSPAGPRHTANAGPADGSPPQAPAGTPPVAAEQAGACETPSRRGCPPPQPAAAPQSDPAGGGVSS